MKKSGVFFHFRDNDTSCSPPHQPFKYKHITPLPSAYLPSLLSSRIFFLSPPHPLSILVVLRFTTVRVTTDYQPPLPFPSPLFRIVGSSLLSLSIRSRILFLLCPSHSLFHHYYTRPYTAIMSGPRYTTQSAVMPAIKLNQGYNTIFHKGSVGRAARFKPFSLLRNIFPHLLPLPRFSFPSLCR